MLNMFVNCDASLLTGGMTLIPRFGVHDLFQISYVGIEQFSFLHRSLNLRTIRTIAINLTVELSRKKHCRRGFR